MSADINQLQFNPELFLGMKGRNGSPEGYGLRAGQNHLADLVFLKQGISVRNEPFNRIIEELAVIAARTGAPVLFMGPTGAGKSLLVRRLYGLKKKNGLLSGEFVELNCAAVQGALAQSMLFGHARGAFTGATSAREGMLRKADKGMLFLDEIGALGFEEQSLLLKAIEEKRFYPLGSDKEAASDFQLVCGTNKDLYAEARAGAFREDLLSRLNTWTFVIPGLRDRPEDIEPNLDFELDQYMLSTGRPLTLEPEARRRFLEFAGSSLGLWLGNFRDFTASVQRMAAFAVDGAVGVAVVEREIERLKAQWSGNLAGYLSGRPPEQLAEGSGACREPGGKAVEYPMISRVFGEDMRERIDLFELPQLETVLRVCSAAHSLAEAGRALYAVSRRERNTFNDSDRLRKYLARFDLRWEDLPGKAAVRVCF